MPMETFARLSLSNTSRTDNPTIRQLYHAENLIALQNLLNDTEVCGKVRLVYIDPPYNTGGDFESRSQQFAYSDRFSNSEYMDFMQKRLCLLHQILADDGSIYVHLDSKMVFHIKILMDSIFGEHHFRGMITRKKCKPKNYTRKTFGNISDYILFYSKSDSPVWNRPYDEWSEEKKLKEYPFIEKETGRRYKKVPIHAPGVRKGATGQAWRGMMPPVGKHWQYTPDRLDEMDANNEIYWSSNGNPRRKVYLDISPGVAVQDIWLDFPDINNQNTLQTGYPTEKNLDMLKRIVEASSNPGDIVLDCFAGSGTTLIAAEELGRQWIGVDCSTLAIETIRHRLEHGSQKLCELNLQKQQQLSLFDHTSSTEVANSPIKDKEIKYDFFEML